MRHDINIVAENFKLDKEKFRAFALKNHNKYGIIDENGFVTTSTWFCDALVTDFKADYIFNSPPSIYVEREVLENVVRYCEAQQVYDKLGAYGDFYYKLKQVLTKK